MTKSVYSRLSVMMFLQFFVWGAWFVTLGTYLNARGFPASNIGLAYLTNNIGAIIAPFFVGMIADRFFASQRVAGVMHLLGAAVLFYVSRLSGVHEVLVWLLVYNACYMSTLGLVNSISFAQMSDPDSQFPKVRVWGTMGWIRPHHFTGSRTARHERRSDQRPHDPGRGLFGIAGPLLLHPPRHAAGGQR